MGVPAAANGDQLPPKSPDTIPMPREKTFRSGPSRGRSTSPFVAPRRARGRAMAGTARRGLRWGLLAGLALHCAAGIAAPAAGASAAARHAAFQPTDELDRLEYVGRAQPALASAQLLRYVDTRRSDDPRYLEALMELGSEFVGLNKGDDVEQVARRIEGLSGSLALARPAAMLLRGQWMQSHGEVSKAERQFIEASALLPANSPNYLRLRLLTSSAFVKRRAGHYDEAMLRYNQALKLVDEVGPTWRRVDLRGLIEQVLLDAGQIERAAEVTREQMRLATESGDEYGMSAAYTARAIQLSQGPDSAAVLAALRSALEHARVSGNKRQIVLGMGNMADYYLSQGDYKIAYDLSQRALPMAREINDPSTQSLALANSGLALISMKRKDEGLPLVRESMSMDERSGSARDIANEAGELGDYLEKAGYLDDALGAYHQYRQMNDELNQQDRQRALLELQESFANENRQHELDMLAREGRLKDVEIQHHDLEIKQWTAAGLSSLLLLALVGTLARRLRARNRMLSVSNEQLRLQAEIDPLTGLSNRHHLQAVMAQRPGRGLEGTLYLVDVDHFKHINDQCGHAGGDSVLVEIARRLRQTLRDDDLVVRWGGEEFLILVRPLPPLEAQALAQRLLCALAEAPVPHDGRAVPVSASIGFALFPMQTSVPQARLDVNWERAIALVDTAMYMAKARGRNGACSIRRIDAADTLQLEDIIQTLEKSARDGLAELHFQHGPVVRGALP
jgi:diguanylate cyclase (GGDEF)-like protein